MCLSHYWAGLANFLFVSVQRDDVATQFTQMNLSRQSSGETPEPPPGPVYPPSLMAQPTQQTSYVIASTGQQLPTGGFSGSGPPISQQVLQAPPSPQGFVQQPPPAQVSMLFLAPVTYSLSVGYFDIYMSTSTWIITRSACVALSGPYWYLPRIGPSLSYSAVVPSCGAQKVSLVKLTQLPVIQWGNVPFSRLWVWEPQESIPSCAMSCSLDYLGIESTKEEENLLLRDFQLSPDAL